MKKPVAAVGGFILVLIAVAVGWTAVERYNEGKTERALVQMVIEAEKAINQQAPLPIDDITTLDSATAVGGMLVYNYTLDLLSTDISPDTLIQELKPIIVSGVCSNDEMALQMNIGAEYRYSYKGSDGVFIGQLDVSKSDCDT